MGELSAILPWTHESIQQTRQGLPLLKFHYRFLYAKVQSRCIQAPEGTVRRPLREKGKILDLWNLFYMAGILLLILFDLWLGHSYDKLAFGILLLFFSY